MTSKRPPHDTAGSALTGRHHPHHPFAQLSVHGLRQVLTGIVFPVRNGYVTLFNKQVVHGLVARPFVPELAGLCIGSVNVNAWIWDVYFSTQRPE